MAIRSRTLLALATILVLMAGRTHAEEDAVQLGAQFGLTLTAEERAFTDAAIVAPRYRST
jgi:hypothetical protein